jgi:hypothetical protein
MASFGGLSAGRFLMRVALSVGITIAIGVGAFFAIRYVTSFYG